VDVKPIIADESLDKSKVWKLMEITESTQCRSIKLADNNNMRPSKVALCLSSSPLVICRLYNSISFIFTMLCRVE
jgi:hypothetical protein